MRIMCVAQVEDRANLDKQIARQTVQPDHVFMHVDSNPARGINARRKRIAHNHQYLREAVEELQPDLIWQIEGDDALHPFTLELLLKDYNRLKGDSFGYVSGVQVGRHGIYALGAWRFNEDRTEFSSADHRKKGIQEVDATGFYCLLAERETWLKGVCSWNDERWGPDVNFGLSLRDQGYTIYADMNVFVGHDTPDRGVIYPDHISICNVRFYRDGEQWKYRTN